MNYTPINHLLEHYHIHSNVHHKPHPEAAPMHNGQNKEHVVIHEHVEHKIQDPHVKQYVQEKPHNPHVPQDVAQAGVQIVQKVGKYPAIKNIHIPISDSDLMKAKNKPPTSSARWLAEFALYLLKKAHIQLRVVHGKVIRVIKR